DVMQTAADLQTCAAYGGVLEELIRVGLDGHIVSQMLEQMLRSAFGQRKPVWGGMLGAETTIGCIPAASSERKAGAVMLKRGAMAGSVSIDGAQEMAKAWMQVGLACEHDELTAEALRDVLGAADDDRLNSFFGYLQALRTVDAADEAEFRKIEGARLRMVMGLPPAPEPTAGG
ncbi:hypothetical protein AB0A05_26795, partial [Streptomyces sp. NPDC046374]|uniref:hypothetical protein n=1 Tax=Streptomyces sp. NPDC046374 TaxID=3154917 RepID=UPI0033FDFDA3